MTCDYCDQPATVITRDCGDVLCARDAKGQGYTVCDISRLTPRTLITYGSGRMDKP